MLLAVADCPTPHAVALEPRRVSGRPQLLLITNSPSSARTRAAAGDAAAAGGDSVPALTMAECLELARLRSEREQSGRGGLWGDDSAWVATRPTLPDF